MRPLIYSILYVLFCGILSHFVGESLPRRWFSPHRFPFASWRWERGGRIYDCLHIRQWKDRVPDMSRICKRMVPKRFADFPTAEAVDRLILETCVAEAVHGALCLLAPVILLFWKNGVGVALTLLVVLCNLPFIMIQRYNRPSLLALRRRLERRKERRRDARSDTVG